ncbi:LamG-like jellyroll fold domain-containing protein [Sphaerotilus sp.]|uniref:LamG-like jellyroll fold domain-containing protein n=1 Tax=Sphaerotilus sp. TaxID=2093942 RepID=UPI002ACE9FF3|nr:M10 family metallopeptidase C-terminal domain-containing protein [Sphaerotilus sp.]MDZ7858763.1 M10 family metallopeptidase C-terminal domain-containing protein [Sphaerotilus sp.]
MADTTTAIDHSVVSHEQPASSGMQIPTIDTQADRLVASPDGPRAGFGFLDLMARASAENELESPDTAAPVTALTCNCPVCSGTVNTDTSDLPVPDGSGIPQLDEQGFLLDPSNPASGLVGTTLSGLPVWSAYETAAHIARPGSSWADFHPDLLVTYTFGVGATLPTGYEAFSSAASQAGALAAMQLYTDVSGVRFIESTNPNDADITYMFGIGSTNGGGWANYPSQGGGYVQVGHVSWEPTMNAGTYALNLLLHELGHGLGLAHPGNYNGNSAVYANADHFNDSSQYTNMSYWSETYTGASFSQLATLGLHDILAMQMEYGINWTTRATDTVYGFNSTAGSNSYNFGFDSTMGFSIWDGGGIDTLDFSGFSGNTVLDLRQGSFSSTGLETYNVSVAYGAVIENGVGGNGNDKMRGNDVGNLLTGGFGDDILYGGAETPVATVVDPRHFTGIQLNEAPTQRNQYLSLTNVSSLSGSSFSVEMLFKLTRMPSSIVPFLSYAVNGNSNELLIEGGNDSTLRIIIDGTTRYDTPILMRTLIDGDPHRLSVTWDSTTGAVSFYIDGTLEHSGVYTAAIGRKLATGGTLVFGQEQDSVGGSFDGEEILPGTLGDIRIFNDVRTAAEIADNAFTPLTGTEQGLLHNWQVQPGDTTKVSDVAVVNPPVNLGDVLPAGAFTATQSSSYDASSGAARVLDDNTGTFNHTKNSGNEWLQLDFNQSLDVAYVEIVNRPSWGSRLNGSTVSVLDSLGGVLYTSAPITGAGDGATITVMLPSVMNARAVRIDQDTNFLHIAELNVYGPAPAGVTVPPALLNTDLTIQGGATAVSTAPVIDLTPDNDTLHGGAGNDTLIGGAGNDVLHGGTGAVSPFTAVHGIRLNQGVTDQYLHIANYGGIAGTTGQVRFTIEMLVSGVSGYNELISYANSQTSNAFLVSLLNNGNIEINYRGTSMTTSVAAALLADGGTHRFSLTWDNRAYVIYIDGAAVGSGMHTSTATSLNAGGTLIIGQEQDSIGGSFSSSQILRGAVGDVRIFNDVRTAEEIAANAFAPLADPLNEQGLVSNWQVTATSIASGALVDTRGGTAMTIAAGNTAAPGLALMGAWDNDSLFGGLGDDTLTGGAGDDTLTGGAGNDTYVVDDMGDVVTEEAGEGTDLVQSSRSYTAAANVENITLTGSGNLNATGNELANILIGNAGNNILDGGTGGDTLGGGTGDDTLIGGAGDDVYIVDSASDVVTEATGEGTDHIQASFSYTASANVENLTLTGSASIDATGNGLNNVITGNAGANMLDGGTGADTMTGRAGNDTYVVDNAGDVVTEAASEGIDLIRSSVSYTASAHVENLTLTGSAAVNATGNALANQLTGNAGDNVLDGGAGADTMAGGAGDDTYVVDAIGDIVSEAAGEGQDLIRSSVSYTLGAHLEDLTLTDSAAVNATGNGLDNFITGSAAANVLHGMGGNDTLDGDEGDDVYLFNLGDGLDTISSWAWDTSASKAGVLRFGAGIAPQDLLLSRPANVSSSGMGDSLILSIQGTTDAVHIDDFFWDNDPTNGYNEVQFIEFADGTVWNQQTLVTEYLKGTSGNDTLRGTVSADTLTGGTGADTMTGAQGDDTYVVETSGDVVIEEADGGTDTVNASVSYTASANVENLTLTGTAAIDATGNALANALTGNGGANILDGSTGADTMAGGAGDDTYVVDNDGDTVIEAVGEGTDLVQSALSYTASANVENVALTGAAAVNATGNALANALTGNGAANRLEGLDGNDTLDGGSGADTLVGGSGDDTYVVDNALDIVTEYDGEGTDTLQSSLTWTLGANLENLTLTGSAALSGFGNSLDNLLLGNSARNRLEGLAGNDTLDGGSGIDTLVGGSGDDTYLVESTGDRVIERSAADGTDTVLSSASYFTLEAHVENLVLLGSASIGGAGNALANVLTGNAGDNLFDGGEGSDTLFGGAGNDSLYGNAGSDSLVGGTGDDTYRVGLSTDIVVELADEGSDTVEAVNTSYTLSDHVENLVLSGAAYYINATGNALANHITGNWGYNVLTGGAGNDTLDGGEGADTAVGGTGDDTYYVNSSADIITELAGEGTDVVFSTARNFIMGANVEHITLQGSGSISAVGNASANTMIGNSGDNTLDGGEGNDSLVGGAGFDSLLGGAGSDTMAGGADSDFYRVGSAGDVVIELANEGLNDTVEAWIHYTLGANVEHLTLGSTNALNGTGNALNNVLTGNAANNVLDGLTGADTMAGGAGNDTYFVDNTADVVNEAAGAGTDQVNASVSYTLKANVERLTLTGSANLNGYGGDDANTLTGNSGHNLLDGGAGNDTLIGGAGNDTLLGNAGDDSMLGGSGNDTYRVASVGDTVVELAGEGTDSVEAYLSYTLGANVENVALFGSALTATGNALANQITGNSLANTLTGAAGNDTYVMGRGSNADTIVDTDASAGNLDTLRFTAGIASDQLWFRALGNDLEVSIIGTSDKATVKDWYLGSQHHLEQFTTADGKVLLDSAVDNLVTAMASFSPPAVGQTSLSSTYQASLATVIAANWS